MPTGLRDFVCGAVDDLSDNIPEDQEFYFREEMGNGATKRVLELVRL